MNTHINIQKIVAAILGIALIAGGIFYIKKYVVVPDNSPLNISSSTVSSLTDIVLSTAEIAGDYNAEFGVGELHIKRVDDTHVYVRGQTIYPGPGNSADAETVEANTGRLDGTVLVQNNRGVYTHAADTTCMLTLSFSKNNVQVSGGEQTCDVLTAIFDGKYEK
ncbi:MAG: hypothetical protein RL094_726 [Candidatus Parcubacteria bacterium]|jgi:hypothetical protein